jgi:hypothetical protein
VFSDEPGSLLFNRQNATTTLVSRSTKGTPALDNSFAADINGDGQYVVYASYAPNLVRPNTTNINIFLYYTNFGATRLISRSSHNGVPGNNQSLSPSISQNGKAVTFLSKSHNLTNDAIAQNTPFSNLFMAFDPVRQIPYYDQTDCLICIKIIDTRLHNVWLVSCSIASVFVPSRKSSLISQIKTCVSIRSFMRPIRLA